MAMETATDLGTVGDVGDVGDVFLFFLLARGVGRGDPDCLRVSRTFLFSFKSSGQSALSGLFVDLFLASSGTMNFLGFVGFLTFC